MREMTIRKELYVKHTPGEYQRADLGTKPFTRERLKQLIKMWSLHDRRGAVEEGVVKIARVDATWLRRLLLLCQVCGSAAQKQDIKAEVPWDIPSGRGLGCGCDWPVGRSKTLPWFSRSNSENSESGSFLGNKREVNSDRVEGAPDADDI